MRLSYTPAQEEGAEDTPGARLRNNNILQPQMTNFRSCRAANWLFLLVSLLTVIVYYPGLAGDYMFDDGSNLLENKQLNIDSLNMESLESAAFSSRAGTLRRPVSMASFALNRYFFGIGPYSNKVVNLAIHLLTGLAPFLLSRLILLSYRDYRKPGLSDGLVTWMPLVVTGLWLVHPLNLSAVLYIVQRMASLSALFTACGLCMYVAGRRRMLAGGAGLAWIIAGLLVFGGLAVFSKENGVLLPLYMLVLETALFRFRDSSERADVKIVSFFILVVAIPAVLALLYLASHASSYLDYSGRDFTLSERLLTEARVLVFYLKMIVMPSIRELGLYHDDIAISHGLLAPPTTLFSLMALGGMLASAVLLLGKRPLISLGIFWFFAGHSLESSIFPLEIAHEHRNYLADYGILLALASGLAEAPLRRLAPIVNYAVPAALFLLFSYTTWLRSEQWSDNINQAVYEARHHPESFRSVFVAGRIHARLALNGQPRSEAKAFEFLEKARPTGQIRNHGRCHHDQTGLSAAQTGRSAAVRYSTLQTVTLPRVAVGCQQSQGAGRVHKQAMRYPRGDAGGDIQAGLAQQKRGCVYHLWLLQDQQKTGLLRWAGIFSSAPFNATRANRNTGKT